MFYAALLRSTNKLAAPNTKKNKIINMAVPFLNFSRGTLSATPNLANTVFMSSDFNSNKYYRNTVPDFRKRPSISNC